MKRLSVSHDLSRDRGWMRHCPLAPYFAIGMFALLPAGAPAQDATFEDGRQAYDFGDFPRAVTIWRTLANHGDVRSESSLAYLYRKGKGVNQNSKMAAAWYYKAAVAGEPTAQSQLCEMYYRGEGVPRDLEMTLLWCEFAINGGEGRAIEFRDKAISRLTTQQRDHVWKLIADWYAHQQDDLAEGLPKAGITEPDAASGLPNAPETEVSR